MKKRNIFAELKEGFDALQAEREGKIILCTFKARINLRLALQSKM